MRRVEFDATQTWVYPVTLAEAAQISAVLFGEIDIARYREPGDPPGLYAIVYTSQAAGVHFGLRGLDVQGDALPGAYDRIRERWTEEFERRRNVARNGDREATLEFCREYGIVTIADDYSYELEVMRHRRLLLQLMGDA
jgi:hypothetical protein